MTFFFVNFTFFSLLTTFILPRAIENPIFLKVQLKKRPKARNFPLKIRKKELERNFLMTILTAFEYYYYFFLSMTETFICDSY